MIAAAILTGCSSPAASDPSAATPAPTPSAASTPSPAPSSASTDSSAGGDYEAFCDANRAAAAAKAGTVGEDIVAGNAQLEAIRAILPPSRA
ncbi:hypothetical protein DVJ78_02210 [Humibacter sp. BT305]|nr:hypothetical protein DVJ78_02210 [Humibacter sp. BT305]